jgi:hypothetical protein
MLIPTYMIGGAPHMTLGKLVEVSREKEQPKK